MKTLRHALALLPLSLALLGLPACESQGVASVEPSPRGEELYDKVNFSKGLERDLVIELARMDRKNDFLRVQIELRNRSTLKQVVLYKYEWFDQNGMMVAETDSTWVEAALFPGETSAFLGTAGSRNATDFRFKVRKK
jgi:uncharacterized protein YcfL